MESTIPRIFSLPKSNFFLFGPRGTGKTTLLKQRYSTALWIDLLEPDIFRSYSAKPERLREIALAYPEKKAVVVDEIQKIPELLSVIHSLIEKKLDIQFILTGSNSRKIKRTGVDLLAGRVIKKTLHPFMAIELKTKFSLPEALKYGLLPLVISASDKESVLKTYIALYMREEVQMEGLVRNIGNFSRFLESVSFSHGTILSITNVARECEVERKVVEGYINILEDLLLSFRLPVFSKRAKRATISHPKFYFFDAGVFRTLRPSGPLDSPEEIEGAALEGLLAQHLLSWNSYRGDKNQLYYWRTKAGSEIDFVLYGPEVFWAIEVKNSSRIHPKDLRSLRVFNSDYPECTPYLLYRGQTRLIQQGILCLPIDEFLLNLNPDSLSPNKIFIS